ncbi:MAG: hypothetical protein ABW205_08655 [Burkholderiales bacterium]
MKTLEKRISALESALHRKAVPARRLLSGEGVFPPETHVGTSGNR